MKSFLASSPGKLILFGEHAIVKPYSKLGVGTSISDFRTFVQVSEEEKEDGKIFINSDLFGNRFFEFKQDDLLQKTSFGKNFQGKFEYDEDIVNRIKLLLREKDPQMVKLMYICSLYISGFMLSRKNEKINKSIRIKINSNFPVGAGLGSSSSFNVSLASSMLKFFEYFDDGEEKNILEEINRFAFNLEKIVHGNPSGLDNTISTYGGFISFKNNEKNLLKFENVKNDINLLIVDTKVKRNTKMVVSGVYSEYERDETKMMGIFDDIGYCSEEFLKLCENRHKISDFEFRDQFNDLVWKNQMLLDQVRSVGHEKFKEIFKIVRGYDLYGKITGAGAGGCAFVYFSNEESEKIEILKKELEDKGFGCMISNDIGGEGVKFE